MEQYFTNSLLEQKIILVTGASSGIGRQIVLDIARRGGSVIACGRNEHRLSAIMTLLPGTGHLSCCVDINDPGLLEEKIAQLPALDGVVHAAGILKMAPFKILSTAELGEIHQTNFLSPVRLMQLLLNGGKIKKGASVVFITSVNGVHTYVRGFGAYASSKAALESAVKIMALEYSARRIRFNAIAPGMIKTEMFLKMSQTLSPELIAADKKNYPLGDYGEPEDVANACLFLLSDLSKWITGTSMVVDGGLTIV